MNHPGTGICECGCGQPTNLAKYSAASLGYVKGQPRRYLPGHNPKLVIPPPVVNANGCWIWQGFIRPDGYGVIVVKGVRYYAHVYYYEQTYGPVPQGLELDHTCRNPNCVNPTHLEPVTHAENMRRSVAVKLNPILAAEIRASSDSTHALARKYNVNQALIWRIKKGLVWR